MLSAVDWMSAENTLAVIDGPTPRLSGGFYPTLQQCDMASRAGL
jgi:hypothetical protein